MVVEQRGHFWGVQGRNNQISRIESAISGHKAIVNELECGILDLANKLNNVSSKLSTFESFVSSSSNVMLNKLSI